MNLCKNRNNKCMHCLTGHLLISGEMFKTEVVVVVAK
jgi:hypothetical protein